MLRQFPVAGFILMAVTVVAIAFLAVYLWVTYNALIGLLAILAAIVAIAAVARARRPKSGI